jgi:predicted metal-binding protein
MASMFTDERREIMGLLHQIVASVEMEAVGMGYLSTRSFAGGSCKNLFCYAHSDCRVLAQKGECRNPHTARPSMSGFGIDVMKLMRTAGWEVEKANRANENDSEAMTWVAGLVLIA